MEDRCPEMITKRADNESQDFCKLSGRTRLLVGGDACSIWNQIQAEWKAEDAERIARDRY